MAEATPSDNSGTHRSTVRELQVEATEYDQGVTDLRDQLTVDERLIAVRVQRTS